MWPIIIGSVIYTFMKGVPELKEILMRGAIIGVCTFVLMCICRKETKAALTLLIMGLACVALSEIKSYDDALTDWTPWVNVVMILTITLVMGLFGIGISSREHLYAGAVTCAQLL